MACSTLCLPTLRRTIVAGLTAGLSLLAPFAPRALALPGDGTYLYGQSPTANQLGQLYVVMAVRQGQVLGAVYVPQSSYECFHGTIAGNTLQAVMAPSFDQPATPHAVALQPTGAIAAVPGAPAPLAPAGYHPIVTLSPLDHQLLQACQSQLGR